MKLSKLIVLATLALTTLPAAAQTCHSLAGHWRLAPTKSKLGSGLSFNPYFAMDAINLVISVNDTRLKQQWNFVGKNVNRNTTYEFDVNGMTQATQVASPLDFEYLRVTPSWQNCTLVVDGTSMLFGLNVLTTNTYVVTADGRQLTIMQYGESPISIVDRQLVFDKSE